MAKSVNKVILVGNLGKDPEVRFTGGGTAVASFSLATTSSYKDKQSGDWKEATEWHNCVAWQKLAEVCRDYLHKGDRIYAEGRLQTRKWSDKQGQDRYTTEVVVSDIVFMGGKKQDTNNHNDFESAPKAPVTTEISDEDIPF